MPSLKAIRKRITSVKNTQKITRAMKLVAAARLRRAQDAITAARPYARGLEQVVAEIAARAGQGAHPLLEVRPERKVELIVLTSDRGLAGAFNSSISRQAERWIYENEAARDRIALTIVGRKGREYFKRRRSGLMANGQELPGAAPPTVVARAEEVAARAIGEFLAGRADAVYVIYNEFKSAISQVVRTERLLPIVPRPLPADASPTDYIYEPAQREVLDAILPLYVRSHVSRVLLESIASEFGSRMSAMDSATNNAREMIGLLTLQYNRARQAAITKELLEIIGGAEALKG